MRTGPSRAARQNQILRNAKFPPDYITAYYREAGDAIARYLASGMADGALLDNTISALLQKEATNIYETRRIAGNVDAIETFQTLLDDIDFGGADPRLGAQTAPYVSRKNVGISVRPEVTLHAKAKSGDLVGGIKLHFPKTEPLDKEQADYVSALLQVYCEEYLWKEGSPSAKHCLLIDLGSGVVYLGIKSIKQRMKDVENACSQIAAIWPTITE